MCIHTRTYTNIHLNTLKIRNCYLVGKEKKAKPQIGRNLLAHVCSFDINVQLGPQEASEPNPVLLCRGSGSMSRQVHNLSEFSLNICLAHLGPKVK